MGVLKVRVDGEWEDVLAVNVPSYGPFEDVFERDDGPVGNGWLDWNTIIPNREDKCGIVNNCLTLTELQGPADQHPDYTGWRGGIARNVGFGGRVSVKTNWTKTNVNATAGPMACFVDGTVDWAWGAWYNHVLGWWELGTIGRDQPDFNYDDLLVQPSPSPGVEMDLRIFDGFVSLYIDGQPMLGPVPQKPDLLNSTWHGVQLDYMLSTMVNVESINRVKIEPLVEPLAPGAVPYRAASGSVGTAVKTASTSTLTLPYPTTISAGDMIYAFAGSKLGGELRPAFSTPAGWTIAVSNAGVSGSPSVVGYRKLAVGTETGTVNFTKLGGADDLTGIMVVYKRNSHSQPAAGSMQGSATPSGFWVTPTQTIFGHHRMQVVVVVAGLDATITGPADPDVTVLSTGVAGGAATRMWLAEKPLTVTDAMSTTPAVAGSLSPSAAPIGMTLVLYPKPAGAV